MEVYQASLLFYTYVFACCYTLQWLVLRSNLTGRTRRYLLEWIGTLQTCAPLFDVGIILGTYGLWGVFVQISLLSYLNLLTLDSRIIANPCILGESLVRTRLMDKKRDTAMFFVVYLAAAVTSFRVVQGFWLLGIVPEHTAAYAMDRCETDLKVSLLLGSAIECVGTFVGRLAALRIPAAYPDQGRVLVSVTMGTLTVLGIQYTGFYCNPAVALACMWDCDGVSRLGHLLVYWAAPLIGWTLTMAAGDDVIDDVLGLGDDDDKGDKDSNAIVKGDDVIDHDDKGGSGGDGSNDVSDKDDVTDNSDAGDDVIDNSDTDGYVDVSYDDVIDESGVTQLVHRDATKQYDAQGDTYDTVCGDNDVPDDSSVADGVRRPVDKVTKKMQ